MNESIMSSTTENDAEKMKLRAVSSNVEVALKELGSYHKYVDEVTEYGHSVYTEHNKMEGLEETKDYAQTLHVHVVAANLTEHLNLQSKELDKLDIAAKTVESRLKLLRYESSQSRPLFRSKAACKNAQPQKIVQLEGDQIPAAARKLPSCSQLDFHNYIPPCRRRNQLQN